MKKFLSLTLIFALVAIMLCSCNSREQTNQTEPENSRLEFINEEFVFDRNEVTFEPEKRTYPLDTTEIYSTLSNNSTDKVLYYGYVYTLQKENNGKWEDIDLGISFFADGITMAPQKSETYFYTISNDKYQIEKGNYRIKQELTIAHIVKFKNDENLIVHDTREGHYEETEYFAEFSIE